MRTALLTALSSAMKAIAFSGREQQESNGNCEGYAGMFAQGTTENVHNRE
jgi:hypothetical protein